MPPPTVAVLMILVVRESTVTSRLTVVLAPLARSPRPHVTVPLDSEQPGEPGVLVTNVAADGSVSVSTTPFLVRGPLLLTVMV